jgi:hypothetical protein
LSFVVTQLEALTAAAGDLQVIGSTITAQNAAAAAPTTGVVPAAADEVSALQATQFGAYGGLYQQVSAQAAAIHETFVNTLGASADSYGATEAANTAAAAGSSGSGLLGFLTGNGPSSTAVPATLAGAGWTTTTAAAEEGAPVATVPAGLPSVASAGRGGVGFGVPRYGVKPTVIPKSVVV